MNTTKLYAMLMVVSFCWVSAVNAHFFSAGGAPGGGGSATNVIGVTLTNENIVPGAPAGTVVGTVNATVTGGGPCTTCTWSMVNTGASSDTVGCSGNSNNLQVVGSGATATIEVLNASLAVGFYGAINNFYNCVKATPAVGTAYTFPFTVMVRANTFTAIAPLTVEYTPGTTSGTTIATMTGVVHGGTFAPTLNVGGDAMCGNISISGLHLVAATTLTAQSGICHVTFSQASVTCQTLNASSATPANCTVGVMIEPTSYVGPGDIFSGDSAFTEPYCYSAAYASPGTNPIWSVVREGDQTTTTINCLPSGDLDTVTLAKFCDLSVCYVYSAADQSGSGNTWPAWSAAEPPATTVAHRPIVLFAFWNDAVPGLYMSNGTDRFFWNPAYSGSGTSGMLATASSATIGLIAHTMALHSLNTGSNPVTHLDYPNATGAGINVAGICVGPDTSCSTSNIASASLTATQHALITVVNGSSSILDVDGVQTTGTLGTANFSAPASICGDFGGGSCTGVESGGEINPNVPSSGQITSLMAILQQHLGTCTGPC